MQLRDFLRVPTNLLVLDVGGTFLKLARVELPSLTISKFVREEMPSPKSDTDGRVSYRISELRPLMARAKIALRDLSDDQSVAVAITGQMHGAALCGWDEPNGEVICWRDSLTCRSSGVEVRASDQVSKVIGDETRVRLGNELREGLPIATLTARRTRGELRSGQFRSILALFAEGLTGQWCGSVHPTDAAASGLADVANVTWARDVIDLLGFGGIELPDIAAGPTTVGTFDGLPVTAPIGDHQAALLGSQLPSGAMSLNIATGGQVSAISDSEPGRWQVRPYFSGRYIRTITHIPSGRAMNALLALLFEGEAQSVSAGWAWIAANTRNLLEVPPASVNASPSFFPSVAGECGALTNLSEENMTRANVIASCASSIVDLFYEYSHLIGGGHALNDVIVTGGLGTRSGLFRSLLRQRFEGQTLDFVNEEDAAVLGAARFTWNYTQN